MEENSRVNVEHLHTYIDEEMFHHHSQRIIEIRSQKNKHENFQIHEILRENIWWSQRFSVVFYYDA